MTNELTTIEGNHSYNLDELLTFLKEEKGVRWWIAVANANKNKAIYERESAASDNYQRMYDAAQHYRRLAARRSND